MAAGFRVSVNAFVLLLCLVNGARGFGRATANAGTTRFVFDGNRVYADLGFIRPDGSIHHALAFVDTGTQFMEVRAALFQELQLDGGRHLRFTIGDFLVDVAPEHLVKEDRAPSSMGSELKVEATLPASVLQRFRLTVDYQRRTLSVAAAGPFTPEGLAIPIRINQATGLAVVDASIDGKSYPLTIDVGSAYTWVRPSAAQPWAASHPDWKRGIGAVGASNMMMSGDGTEIAGTLLRVPVLSIGPLVIRQIGVLAVGRGKPFPGGLELFDWYSEKNPEPVAGWIGGNLLGAFRLTLDYPNRMSYWVRQSEDDPHDLDQIGLTLQRKGDSYVVAAVATQEGRPTVADVVPGDHLIRVGELDLTNATWGAIYNAMHGTPGASRLLVVERNGTRRTINATITRF